ncbi:hypothetical protein HPB48_011033 [Haemaphysalis longicornis]|uniref:Sulfatase n=1 Tax=Haemaphysalis longicornis TaxID=44386 RepID=A0A9J6GS36_HAELO|nr:hypothetical protein HPB48_011033 [Haemaphysalis longicornis]
MEVRTFEKLTVSFAFLSSCRAGFPFVVEDNLLAHNVHPNDLVCTSKEIYLNDSFAKPDSVYMEGGREDISFDKPLDKEFLFVECATRQSPGFPFHEQFLLNPKLKTRTEERCRNARRQTPHNLSVLVLGLDSVSYLNLDRHLPETAWFMREELGAFELHGYNKLGDNSYPNQVPLIMGLKDFEANKAAPDGFYDKLSAQFIWNKYAERGYRTMFLEEWPYYGLFNYFRKGFRHSPADYYLRPVIMAMDDSPRNTKNWESVRCLGPTMPFEELLDYLDRFTRMMGDRPFFSYTWISEITHDSLNSAGYADAPFRRHLQSLRESGVLNRTILVFLSDHGLRFGDVRATYIGKFEDRQPFAFLAFPPWFLSANPEAERSLRVNQQRLTTHFDVHAMLVELLDYPRLKKPNTTYGLSLLHEVPGTRTCAEASIGPQWCTCSARANDTVSEKFAASLAEQLLQNINEKVSHKPRWCSQYMLLQMMDVTVLQPTVAERATNTTHYWVTIKLSPGEAVFEGTVRAQGDNMTVLKEISRCNWYSDSSYCLPYTWLGKYCYCRRTFGDVI